MAVIRSASGKSLTCVVGFALSMSSLVLIQTFEQEHTGLGVIDVHASLVHVLK